MKIPTLEMKSATRISMDRILLYLLLRLNNGNILDVGSGDMSPYINYITRCKYKSLDSDPSNKPDYYCSIEKMKVKSNSFDNILATEVLEHSSEPQKAINEIYRVLKKNGKCILTTRFLYPYHANPHDYFRFTHEGIKYLFKKFKKVEVYTHGNSFLLWWESINRNFYTRAILNIFNPIVALFDWKDDKFYSGVIVYAEKA